jgi:dCTP diphosphatase
MSKRALTEDGAASSSLHAGSGAEQQGSPKRAAFSDLSLETIREAQASFAAARDWDQFHTPRNLALALVGEVGELCEIFQWRSDDAVKPGLPGWKPKDKEHLGQEMSDCLLYLVRLADRCDVDLSAAVQAKIDLNAAKYPADKVRGSSKKYTEYQ